MASLVLYGSAVADATLTTACDMAAASGGVETSKTSTPSGTNNICEVMSKGGTPASVTAIPATPTGNGWVYNIGPGAFALGNWSASATISSSFTADALTMRFFRYSSGVYTLIGSIVVGGPANSISIAKTTYSFAATSMAAITFAAGDLLYTDLWLTDANGNVSGDNPVVYISTTSTAGVASDMQVTTSNWSPGFIIYGSNVANGTLATASTMSSTTGGVEASVAPVYSGGSGFFAEMPSRAQTLPVSAAIATTGKGWVFSPGSGVFATGNWSAKVTMSSAGVGASSAVTVRFLQYSGGTYTLIGSIANTTPPTAKTTMTFAPTSMTTTTFAATDLVYVDLWWNDPTGANDTQVNYASNSASAGVANDMQITTAPFSATTTNVWTANDVALTPTESIVTVVTQQGTDSLTPDDTFSFAALGTVLRYLTRLAISTTSYGFDVFQNNTESGPGPTITFTCTPGTFYWTRMRVQGNFLYGKVWADGSGEPGWTIITELDSQVITGAAGIMLSSTSATLPVKVDNLSMTNLGGPVETATFSLTTPTIFMTGVDQSTVTDSLSTTGIFHPTDALTVLDADQIAGADEILAVASTDTLSVSETTLETKTQVATDTLTSTETTATALALNITESATVVESTTGVILTIGTDSLATVESSINTLVSLTSENVAITETMQEVLATALTDIALSALETTVETLVSQASEILVTSEVDSLLLSVAFSESVATSDSMTSLVSTLIALADVALTPTDSLKPTLAVNINESATSLDVLSITDASAFTDSLVASDTLAASVATLISLTDLALLPADNLLLLLQNTISESVAITETVQEVLATALNDTALSALESVLVALFNQTSDTLVTSETTALSLSVGSSDAMSITESLSQLTASSLLDSALIASESLASVLALTLIDSTATLDVTLTVEVTTVSDTLTITESFAASYANIFAFADSSTTLELTLLTLAVNLLDDQLFPTDSLTSSEVHVDSQMSGTDVSTLVEFIAATQTMLPVDQLGTIFDQSTTTGIVLESNTFTLIETLSAVQTNATNLIDTFTVTESLLSATAHTFTAESVTLFEVNTLTTLFVPTENLTISETLASFAVMLMNGVDTSTSSDLLKSIDVFLPIETIAVSEGVPALSLLTLWTDNSATSDNVKGDVAAPFTDTTLTLSDTLGTTFTLSFADTLVHTDVSRETLSIFATDTTPVVQDVLTGVPTSPLLTDNLVPSESFQATLRAALGPDALLVIDALLAMSQTYILAMQGVRSGIAVMLVHTTPMEQRVRSGNASMTTRTGDAPQGVRTGNMQERV